MNITQISSKSKNIRMTEKSVCNGYYLMEFSGLSEAEIAALIDHDLLIPLHNVSDSKDVIRTGDTVHFALHALLYTTSARRLRDDFELDSNGLILALNLMRRIDNLQEELGVLRACLPATTFYSVLT